MVYLLSPEEREMIETYDRIAKDWNDINPPHFQDVSWCEFVSRIEGETALDLGCGTGRVGRLYLDDGFRHIRYIGIDLSERILEVARRDFAEEIARGDATFLRMNMCELAFRNESIPAFSAIASFMLLPRGKLSFALKEANRVLKPNGVGFISIPRGSFEGMWEPRERMGRIFCACWEPDDLEMVLNDAGFEIIFDVASVDYFDSVSGMNIFVVKKFLR